MTWIAPNLVQWDRVLPYCTGGSLWGPFWANWSYFKALELEAGTCFEPMSSLFLTHLATQNDLIGPSSGTMGQGITILYWWGPLEAILGHFRVILWPRARGLGLFRAYYESISHPFGYPKRLEWPQIWYSGTGYYHTVVVGAFGGNLEWF